jgi:hypothetical protein
MTRRASGNWSRHFVKLSSDEARWSSGGRDRGNMDDRVLSGHHLPNLHVSFKDWCNVDDFMLANALLEQKRMLAMRSYYTM